MSKGAKVDGKDASTLGGNWPKRKTAGEAGPLEDLGSASSV